MKEIMQVLKESFAKNIPRVFVGDKPLEKYIATFHYVVRSSLQVVITARGRNTSRAIDLALWVKTNSGYDIMGVRLESVSRERREDKSRTIFMSQIEILMRYDKRKG